MKSSDQWAEIILGYLQKNPVKTLEKAKAQIKAIVEMIQEDMLPVVSGAANDDEPDNAA